MVSELEGKLYKIPPHCSLEKYLGHIHADIEGRGEELETKGQTILN